MDIPATAAGTVREVRVKAGDRVSTRRSDHHSGRGGSPAIPPKERIKEEAAPSPGPGRAGLRQSQRGYEAIEVRIPDIGDYKDVPIIEVHVQPGATIKVDDPLITLESDKATMEVPAAQSGTIREVKVKVGDRVSEDDVIAIIETECRCCCCTARRATRPGQGQAGYGSSALEARPDRKGWTQCPPQPQNLQSRRPATSMPRCWCSEPARAATPPPSGPPISARTSCWSSAGQARRRLPQRRLHSVQGAAARRQGRSTKRETWAPTASSFAEPQIDIDKLRGWKDGVVKRLTGGLAGLAKQRKVDVVPGIGRFVATNQLEVRSDGRQVARS